MIHFHATKKLLNVSHIQPVLYVSEPVHGQRMHDWYVALLGSGFPGKMLLLYVHKPSLLAVVVKGKTIRSTVAQFRSRLRALLIREKFPVDFIEREMEYAQEYIVGKTNSKSMLANINHMISQIEAFNLRYFSYEDIDLDEHEEIFMDWLYTRKGKSGYTTSREYWTERFG